jgi:DNA ligase-1
MSTWQAVLEPDGLHLPQAGLWLDPRAPKSRAFVSHAHFDHMAAHGEVYLSPPTARLMQTRLAGQRTYHPLPFGQPHSLGEFTLTLHPAGHVFGSAMLRIDGPPGSLLYTGDFKLRPGRSSERCQPVRADVLIMETTYGLPQYIFPPAEEVLASLVRFCREGLEENEVPVLFGYSLGKSQEILSSLHGEGLPVMLHPNVLKITKVYQELGIPFPPYLPYDPARVHGHVLICPPNSGSSTLIRKIARRRTAAVTGWAMAPGARFRYQCDAVFPLSDHAGYDDLLALVEEVNPRMVYTLHGFAHEFARDLRQRGRHALALGGDNQLEFSLDRSVPSRTTRPHPASIGVPDTGWGRLCHALETAGRTTKKSAKVATLANYLANLSRSDLILAARFLSGTCFPRAENRSLQLGSSLLRRAAMEVTGLDRSAFRAAYLRHQDTGETLQDILSGHSTPAGWSLADISGHFERLAGARAAGNKLSLLTELFRSCHPVESKWAVKIMTGTLRAGLREGIVEEALAACFRQPLEAIQQAHMLTGDLGLTAGHAADGTLDRAALTFFQPVRCMLASPEPDAAAIHARSQGTWIVEHKFDGIRCQLHREGSRAELFSRDLKRITPMFPEIAAAALHLPAATVLDGELLAYAHQRALPFADLQKRLGRRDPDLFLQQDIPLVFMAFDCLRHGAETLVGRSWRERRAILETLLSPPPERILLAPVFSASTPQELDRLFLTAKQSGNEGLMVKDPASTYQPGRRGIHWLKLKKAAATLDVVVVAAEWGHGKRKDMLSDVTFAVRDDTGQLRTIGKAYSGLTDDEIRALTARLLDLTVEITGRKRKVRPEIVLEIAFDSIQRSDRHDSGFALRFPRIVRLRDDKSPSDIDTLATCQKLASPPT